MKELLVEGCVPRKDEWEVCEGHAMSEILIELDGGHPDIVVWLIWSR